MKKCYLVPTVSVSEVQITSLMANSPFTDGSNQLTIPGGNGSTTPPPAGEGEEMEARGRGGDFGSLW